MILISVLPKINIFAGCTYGINWIHIPNWRLPTLNPEKLQIDSFSNPNGKIEHIPYKYKDNPENKEDNRIGYKQGNNSPYPHIFIVFMNPS